MEDVFYAGVNIVLYGEGWYTRVLKVGLGVNVYCLRKHVI